MTERYVTGKELADFIAYIRDVIANSRNETACCDCAFWDPYGHPCFTAADRIFPRWTGECHRFPPTLPNERLVKKANGNIEPAEGVWPETPWNEWCGEFVRDHFSALRELEWRQKQNCDEENNG